ncbi:MAG: hypothetical protein ACHQ0J_01215 [Candidatus Dormibacterales bacterium]
MKAVALAFVLFLVAGCGSAAQTPVAGSGYSLYEATSGPSSQQISVIDLKSGKTQRNLPFGTPSGDWKHLYSVVSASVVDADPQSGAILNSIKLSGDFQLPFATASGMPGGLSPNGSWLVVESFDGNSTSPPTATHMLVIDNSVFKVKYRVDLQGFFEFDAMSNDGLHLYLIQYLSGTEQYYVRLYNLDTGRLADGVIADKTDGGRSMAGVRLSGVASPDGQWLFSIYVRQHESPFIHALNLGGSFAFCLDLPGAGYADANGDSAMHWSLALSPDASRLYAVNAAAGIVATVDTGVNGFPSIIRTASLNTAQATSSLVQSVEAKELGANAAVVSRDGATLVAAGSTGLVWIDTATLKLRSSALAGLRVWSIGLSPDGTTLYALDDAGDVAGVSMGGSVGTTFHPDTGYPMAIMRVAVS